jgi:hypothetical protein
LKISIQPSVVSNQLKQRQTQAKKGFDKAVIRLSNCTLVCVFNKNAYPRVGAESYANFSSFTVAPLVQDDDLKRGEYCARASLITTLCLTSRKTNQATGILQCKSGAENRELWPSTARSPLGGMLVSLLFATKLICRVGRLAEECRQRVAKEIG